jgi:DNA-binding response OmpR family regulator
MSETLARLLSRLSEAGEPAILWGREASAYFGKDFERLLDQGVLVEQAQASEWDVCLSCDCGLEVRPIQTVNGHAVAVCPLDHRQDRVLETCDLQSFRINSAALVRQIAIASGFSSEPSEIMPGLWHLGQASGHRELHLAVTRAAAQQPGVIAKLRILHPSAEVVMIVPLRSVWERATFMEAGIQVVAIDECVGGSTRGAFAIDAAKLEAPQVSVPRLVIGRAARTVSLDGHVKTLPDQAFQLLLLLAEHALKFSGILENRVIEGHLWGSNIHKITSQVREPVRALRDALAIDSSDSEAVRALIENRRNPNGYRLALAPQEIEIEP